MTNDPVLIAYAARRSPKTKRVQYTRIGRAYPHDTGAGLTLILDALPISFNDTHIVLLELDEADDRRLLAEARRREGERKTKAARRERD
jgi:hypothetical protein